MDEPFEDPDIPHGEATSYRGLVGGREIGTGTMVVEQEGEGARGAYRQRISMAVEGELHYDLDLRFARINRTLVADSYHLETRGPEGPIAVEEGWFRDVRGLRWGGDLAPYTRSVTPLLGCALALRGFGFERGAHRRFELWLANTVTWEVEAHVERIERIGVPAGPAQAWRVRVRPSFEHVTKVLDRVIGLLLPPFILHFDAEPPHRMLRFEFPTGPFRWNPRGLIEATQIDPPSA